MRGGPHLDVRPVDAATGSIFLKMGVGFFAMGLVMAAVGILALQDLVGGMGRSEGYGFTAFGVLGAIGSIFLARWALWELRTVVRFAVHGDDLVIEWRRGNDVFRTERVKRWDVVEVAVTDAPSSGASSYGFIVGMKNGEIDLTRMVRSGTQAPRHYVEECRRLAQFLGVPSRVP
ncbi:MAG: hypothetical protein U0270_16525 [Labilithrix sp.]